MFKGKKGRCVCIMYIFVTRFGEIYKTVSRRLWQPMYLGCGSIGPETRDACFEKYFFWMQLRFSCFCNFFLFVHIRDVAFRST